MWTRKQVTVTYSADLRSSNFRRAPCRLLTAIHLTSAGGPAFLWQINSKLSICNFNFRFSLTQLSCRESVPVNLSICDFIFRTANSNLKELDHFAELELELEKIFFLNSNLNSHKTVRVH